MSGFTVCLVKVLFLWTFLIATQETSDDILLIPKQISHQE